MNLWSPNDWKKAISKSKLKIVLSSIPKRFIKKYHDLSEFSVYLAITIDCLIKKKQCKIMFFWHIFTCLRLFNFLYLDKTEALIDINFKNEELCFNPKDEIKLLVKCVI